MEQRYKIGWCGPASLAHAIIQVGLPKPNQKILGESIGTTFRDGTPGPAMVKGAKLFGLEAQWEKGRSLEDLVRFRKMGAAVIVNWMSGSHDRTDGHYSVFEQMDHKWVVLNDPDWMGRLTIVRIEDFLKIWYDKVGKRFFRQWALVLVNPQSGLGLSDLLQKR